MARPSRVKSPKAKFVVYEDADTSIPSPDSSHQPSPEPKNECHQESGVEPQFDDYVYERTLEDITEDITPLSVIGEQTDTEIDDGNEHGNEDDQDRRESTFTRGTSISSLPESSVFDTDHESRMPAMHQPYTPPSTRPTFRRPDSVRRMQLMASPTPFERSSPRRSALRAKSRTGTPRSVRQSPRPKSRYQEEEDVDEEKKEYPLVLLHVTLLPVELRWSAESMLQVLPSEVIENLQLLRSRVSDTILHRGILLPHPREDYERLEERLLEALELRKERVTKCGHFFRARDSTNSLSSSEGSTDSADSGVGSSVADEDVERCMTCSSPVKGGGTALDASGKRWSIKVFAANGLMRASAWTAAWSEMERVDVEILPWISESLRKQLDAIAEREEDSLRHRQQDDQTQVTAKPKEHSYIALEDAKGSEVKQLARHENYSSNRPQTQTQPQAVQGIVPNQPDLPQVYRAADIPLSLLMKNYVYLLARDKRNIAIFALATLALWTSLRVAVLQSPELGLVQLSSTCTESTFFAPHNGTASLMTENNILDNVADSSATEEALGSTSAPAIEDGLQSEAASPAVREGLESEGQLTPPAKIDPPWKKSTVGPPYDGSGKEVSSFTPEHDLQQYTCISLNLAQVIFALAQPARA